MRLKVVDLVLDFNSKFVMVKLGFGRFMNFLKFSGEVGSNFDILGLNFLFQFEHQLQQFLVLVLLHAIVGEPINLQIVELDGQLGVHFLLKFGSNSFGFSFELVLMGEFLGDSVKVDQDFLESFVVGGLELVEPVAERISDILKLFNLSPLLEFEVSSQSLHCVWRI